MKLESIRSLRGPNLWSDHTALEAAVLTAETVPATDAFFRLCGSMPHDVQAQLFRDVGEPGALAFWPRVLEKLTLGLLQAAGCEVAYSRTVEVVRGREYRVVCEYTEETSGKRALQLALELIEAARASRPSDFAAEVRALRKLNEDVRLGPSTGSITRAAEARRIPVRRMTNGSLVQLGYGARARRIWAAETDRTSAVAESIAQDKELTKSLLSTIGIPVPQGVPAFTAEQAWEIAQQIGLPVVVKPRKGNQGRGVSVRLTTREAVMAAFEIAFSSDGEVIVERHLEGADFRLLVVGGRLVAAARREPPQVTGDGTRSIAELVAQENL
ncbi:MAG TPA: acetate--CoA ligase family protein, partial [Polyangiaceae bacterium]